MRFITLVAALTIADALTWGTYAPSGATQHFLAVVLVGGLCVDILEFFKVV